MKNLFLLAFLLVGQVVDSTIADEVDYNRSIKPLLAKHCVTCHGEARPRGGLRLDLASLAIQGGKGGPALVAGDAQNSSLIEYVSENAGPERMPLKRPPLTTVEIQLLTDWIDQGAKFPEDEAQTTLQETHWAFTAPTKPTLPHVSDSNWAAHPIDAFVLTRLEQEKISPSPEASRQTLLRRVTLDLTGVPPIPEETVAFLDDTRPDAYERVVDRLLASPRFGERWARPWLDLARYADSNGYSIDAPRTIWKYRDWVIEAVNSDLPFDQFIMDQLAGDLRPNASLSQRVATGFHRNTQINEEGGIDPEQFRVEAVADRVNTTATAFLGLTMGCAQCHDHKYDPLSQREYYQLFAFFNSVDEPEIEFATPEELRERDNAQAAFNTFLDEFKQTHPEADAKVRNWEAQLAPAFKVGQPSATKKTFDVAIESRTAAQNRLILELYLVNSTDYPQEQASLLVLKQKLKHFVRSMVVQERAVPRPSYIQLGGDFSRRGEDVQPGVPKVLPALSSGSGQASRLDLARWLADPGHPLTARVAVNRVWQTYFGLGLVETENDFGTQGAPPSHPELLDWLATELASNGWSMKTMHRRIVTSKTYKQASTLRPELERIDPANRKLARQSRLRLDAELIRDATLASSGLLASKLGGPSVFPPQPEGVMGLGQVKRTWTVSQGADRYRRGLYTHLWRASPHPALTVFDAPNGIQACTKRGRSNTPVQALMLLNDEAFFEAAQALASRVLKESPSSDLARLEHAFQICLSRSPSDHERATLEALLAEERAAAGAPSGGSPSQDQSAWTTVSRVLLNLDEFMTRE